MIGFWPTATVLADLYQSAWQGREINKEGSVSFLMRFLLFMFWFNTDYMAKVLKPPSTTATVPVTNLAASLMR